MPRAHSIILVSVHTYIALVSIITPEVVVEC